MTLKPSCGKKGEGGVFPGSGNGTQEKRGRKEIGSRQGPGTVGDAGWGVVGGKGVEKNGGTSRKPERNEKKKKPERFVRKKETMCRHGVDGRDTLEFPEATKGRK